jgi:peroxiredoxin
MGVADKILMKTGTRIPAFGPLKAVDGKSYSLNSFESNPVLVVIFSCNHCPYVQAYEDRIMALQSEFKAKGVQFIAINANDALSHPDDNFESMVKRANEKKFNFVYLRDEDQAVARAFGATHTPHLFVFDSSRTLAYTGRIDDNWKEPGNVTRQYLREALEALVAGQKPAEPETFAIGCTIKWKSQ